MENFTKYNHRLKVIFDEVLVTGNIDEIDEALCSHLVDQQLRSSASIESLREAGSFFTGDALANEMLAHYPTEITFDSKVMDPTCGAGNLLLACSKSLPVMPLLSDTLSAWGRVLYGCDLVESFVEATKFRIVLECIRRGAVIDLESLDIATDLLFNIKVFDALEYNYTETNFTHVIMNPPFTLSKLKKYDLWRSGKVNLAAVIFNHILDQLSNYCEIVAILPEVLRSGSRYENWRSHISSIMGGEIIIKGRFDSKTDVDVFIISGSKKSLKAIKWSEFEIKEEMTTIGELFNVSVGTVVPHRDPIQGNLHPYIYPKMLPVWGEVSTFDDEQYRQYAGKVFSPPFVAIRRTSSPGDGFRASATLILGEKLVAVENHLIVVKPLDNKLDTCMLLMSLLQSKKTSDFLDKRIRCRHLTVSAVKDIPFLEGTDSD